MKKRRLKRKAVVTAVAVIAVIFGIFGFMFITDMKQEEILREEIKILAKKNVIEDRYNRPIKTKGEYAEVEKSIKKYWDDYAVTLQNIVKLVNDDTIANMLTVENYETDGPNNFKESKEYLTKAKEEINSNINKLSDMSSPDKLLDNVNSKDFDTYYKDLYRELLLGTLEGNSYEFSPETTEKINNILNIESEVIDLLVANQGKWSIKNDKIIFTETGLLNQYNELTKKLK